jgi:hypothetical protein
MDSRELTFPIAMDRLVMWLMAGGVSGLCFLVGWLCLQQMEQGKVLTAINERSMYTKEQMQVFHNELERLTLTDNRLSLELKRLQIQAAEHGWKQPD